MLGKITLGRSFGVVPANRGVVVGGPYNFVRHPIYTGYLITHVAFLVANPVPLPAQLDPGLHDRALAEAWRTARERGISGPETTPFLLEFIRAATGERSLEANIAAYFHNIAVAAECAHAHC